MIDLFERRNDRLIIIVNATVFQTISIRASMKQSIFGAKVRHWRKTCATEINETYRTDLKIQRPMGMSDKNQIRVRTVNYTLEFCCREQRVNACPVVRARSGVNAQDARAIGKCSLKFER